MAFLYLYLGYVDYILYRYLAYVDYYVPVSGRRVLDIFAPSLGLSPYIDTLGRGHPFSVK